MLFGRGQSPIERNDVESVPAGERLCRVSDLPLTRQEDQNVAAGVPEELVHRRADGLNVVGVLGGSVAHLDRMCPALHGYDGGCSKVISEALGVESRRRDDDAKLRSLGEQPRQISEKEVDIE